MIFVRTKQRATLFAGIVLLLGSAVSGRAAYVFNFNSLSVTPNNGTDSSSAIATYMDGVLGCANCVTVSAGVAVDQRYNGDGYVTGPGSGGTSLTLGNTDGATASNSNSTLNGSYDSYISNTSADVNGNNPDQLSQGITISFSAGHALTGAFSFDYEIFPDGSCPVLNAASCGGPMVNGHYPNQPDLDFIAMAGSTTLVNTTFYGVTPGNGNGTATHSPVSGSGATVAPQLIGTYSTTLNGASQLEFLDWPATIGVDNLVLTNTSTPEPRGEALLLGALLLAAMAGMRLRRGSAKS